MIRFCVILCSWVDQKALRTRLSARVVAVGILFLMRTVRPAPSCALTVGSEGIRSEGKRFAEIGIGVRQNNIATILKPCMRQSVENCATGSTELSSNQDASIVGIKNIPKPSISITCETRNATSPECAIGDCRKNQSSKKCRNARSFARIAIVIGHG